MKKTIKVGICMMTALTLIAASLVGCSVQSGATEPTGSEQTNNSLETTRGPTDGTTDVPTEIAKPDITEPETTGPDGIDVTVPETTESEGVDTTVPTTKPVETTAPTDPVGPTAPTDPVGPTAPVETTVPATEPPETTAPPVTEPPVTTTPSVTEPLVETTQATEPPIPVTTGHTHRYTETVVAATCSTKGYTHHECACGDSYDDSETAALGHSWGEWTVVRAATTEAVGLERRYCNNCRDFENRTLAKLDKFADAEYLQQFLKDAAAYTIQYINQFRVEQGGTAADVLPGLTQVAEYRAVQLLDNYSHDEHALREATAYYKYGEYVDLTKYGYDESYNYYSFGGAEAIAKAGHKDPTAEKLGKAFAESLRDSAGHWRYVGNSENSYIAVAISYDKDAADGYPWKCCMLLSKVNYG